MAKPALVWRFGRQADGRTRTGDPFITSAINADRSIGVESRLAWKRAVSVMAA